MARKTTDIVYGVSSQTVEYRVPQGRPTSATFQVFNDDAGDDDTAEFSGTATVTSPSTTVDAASGPAQADPQKLSIAATTDITTARKFLVAEGSKQEWVTPIEIVSADYIRCRHPLKNDYTTAATFVSTTITAAIDATWVADEGNLSEHEDPNPSYRVRWEIVVSGVTYVAYSYFDLVRAAVEHQVDIDDINPRAPGLYASLPTEYRVEQGRPLVDTAVRAVKADLAAMQLDTDAIRDDEVFDELVILRALWVLAAGGWRPAAYSSLADYITETRNDYQRFFEMHFKVTLQHKIATGTGGGADVVSSRPYFLK